MKKSPSLPTILNRNVTFIDNPISWVFYTLIVVFFRIVVSGIGFSGPAAWTIVNYAHGICTFIFLHWIKGSPFVDDHGQYSQLTFWEQIDDCIQYTKARKFFTLFPIVLFFLTVDSAGWELAWGWINLIITVIVVLAKLPIMHKVRIFGINA